MELRPTLRLFVSLALTTFVGLISPAAGSDSNDRARFWSFQRPQRHIPHGVPDSDWVRRSVDAFVLARLQAAGLQPNDVANRLTLVRRVTFDLIGLPPTPAEVVAFVDDEDPLAYERLVDRLLASPHYGERWARMWLDVARYAEDQAYGFGSQHWAYPNAYRYRDWVIQAWNEDLPYDRFVTCQLAADMLDDADEADHVALGFLGLGPKYARRDDDPSVLADEWEERVDVVTRGLLGLTMACARCHDHKYDPIPTEDYYSLAGVFASTNMFDRPLDGRREKKEDGEATAPIDALHIVRDGEARDLNVMIRGNPDDLGPLVARRFLQALSNDQPPRYRVGSGRLELAGSITSPDNPLTARVFVNRVWALHFGKPLVATPSNFGRLGERPTHPALLDDLAVRFMQAGWSIKWLHREIVLSAAYRQSSEAHRKGLAVDPENRLLWRMNRKRLSVESWRDALLAASGTLDRTIGGHSIAPQDPDGRRRTVYSRISRLQLDHMLLLFDFPDPNAHSARRVETTTPTQKLFMLNSPFVARQALHFARRLLNGRISNQKRIVIAYLSLLGRPPSADEVSKGLQFLRVDPRLAGEVGQPSLATSPAGIDLWQQYAQTLICSNEAMMID